MSTVNYTNYNIDQTVRVFDNFYKYDVNIPAAEYDVVHSYFLKEMKTEQAAGNFTVSLFRVAEETGVPAMTLLNEFQGSSGINLNIQLAYFLNQIRSRATLLGVSNPVTPNFYAARNVIQ
jgi:pyruvate/2-oxoacid:ferredoxin oxidoreductase alpha subunit